MSLRVVNDDFKKEDKEDYVERETILIIMYIENSLQTFHVLSEIYDEIVRVYESREDIIHKFEYYNQVEGDDEEFYIIKGDMRYANVKLGWLRREEDYEAPVVKVKNRE